jgi:hypothetical protein
MAWGAAYKAAKGSLGMSIYGNHVFIKLSAAHKAGLVLVK